jgi:hypothetical protein
MIARRLTFMGWVAQAPMVVVTEWLAARWVRKPARSRGLGLDDASRRPRVMPSGPHPHACERLSLWSQVELLSRR